MRFSFQVLLLALAAVYSAMAQSGVTDNVPKYSDLAAWGSANQFDIRIQVGRIPSKNAADPLEDPRDLSECLNEEYQDPSSSACNYPPIKDNSADVIQVTISLKEGIDAVRCQVEGDGWSDKNREPTVEATPTRIESRLCYSQTAFTERPWRKKNKPYPSLSQNCGFKVARSSVDSTNEAGQWVHTRFFDDLDEVPSATYFIMVHVLTDDKTVCGWTSTENVGYILTEVDMGRTGGVIAAAIVFSIFSVVFLVCYNVADKLWYNKNGRELTFI